MIFTYLKSSLDPTQTLTQLDLLPNPIFSWTKFIINPSWLSLGIPRPWFFLTRTQGLDPPVDSDSISIWTCFLNLLLEFIWTPYPSNLCPIGLPDLIRSDYPNLARTAYLNSTRSTLLKPYLITSLLTWPYTFISGSIILPDSSPNRVLLTRPYTVLPGQITLPHLFLIWLLPTQPYTVLPNRITLPDIFPIGLQPTRLYPATLPDFLTRPGNTSLHPTALPALPNHPARYPWTGVTQRLPHQPPTLT
jgi:hypothetical protein